MEIIPAHLLFRRYITPIHKSKLLIRGNKTMKYAHLLFILLSVSGLFAQELYLTESIAYNYGHQGMVAATYTTEYTYDEEGNELFCTITSPDENDNTKERREKSFAGPKVADTVSTMIYQYWDDTLEAWVDSLKSDEIVTKSGLPAGYSHSHANSSGWYVFARGNSTFNTAGLRVVDTFFTIRNSEVYSYYVDSSYYDRENKLIKNVRFQVEEGTRKDIYDIMYTYNSDGKVVNELHMNWNGSTWYTSYRDSTSYEGDTVTVHTIRYKDEQWVPTKKVRRVTNEQGLLTDSIEIQWKDEQWDIFVNIQYHYNRANRLTLREVSSKGAKGLTPLLQDKIEYIQDTLISSVIRERYVGGWLETEWYVKNTYKTLEQITSLVSLPSTQQRAATEITPKRLLIHSNAATLKIYSLQGKCIHTITGCTKAGKTSFTLPQGLSKAPYILRITDTKGKAVTTPIRYCF